MNTETRLERRALATAPELLAQRALADCELLSGVLRDAATLLSRVRGLVLSPTTAAEIEALVVRCRAVLENV